MGVVALVVLLLVLELLLAVVVPPGPIGVEVVLSIGLTTLDRIMVATPLRALWNRWTVWLTAWFTRGSPLGLNSKKLKIMTTVSLFLLTLNIYILKV